MIGARNRYFAILTNGICTKKNLFKKMKCIKFSWSLIYECITVNSNSCFTLKWVENVQKFIEDQKELTYQKELEYIQGQINKIRNSVEDKQF